MTPFRDFVSRCLGSLKRRLRGLGRTLNVPEVRPAQAELGNRVDVAPKQRRLEKRPKL